MSKRTNQRDVNLSRQLQSTVRECLRMSNLLTDPSTYGLVDADDIRSLESSLFDSLVAVRVWNRVTTPIKIKGQRG